MKFKRLFKLFTASMMLFLLAVPAISVSGAKTNFAGTWTYNESKSQVGESRMRNSPEMIVKQEANKLTIESTFAGRDGEERKITRTLSLDGKESTNGDERRTTISTATWSGDGTSLNIKSNMKFTRDGETMEVNTTEIWKLDKTGKILTIETASTSSRGDRKATLVYDLK